MDAPILVPTIMFFLMLFLPDTAYWLIENGDKNGGEKSMRFYRGKGYNINQELDEIKEKHQNKIQANSGRVVNKPHFFLPAGMWVKVNYSK